VERKAAPAFADPQESVRPKATTAHENFALLGRHNQTFSQTFNGPGQRAATMNSQQAFPGAQNGCTQLKMQQSPLPFLSPQLRASLTENRKNQPPQWQ